MAKIMQNSENGLLNARISFKLLTELDKVEIRV